LSDREVATECPWLSGRIGTAYATGFQTGKGEDGGKFLLGVITLKHWAGYTVETDRSGYNSVITPFDLADSYLPAFRAAVRDGKAAGVMCSYNSINGVPTCADTRLTQILRGTWEFDGYITSDSGAIHDISGAHKYLNMSAEEGTAAALKAGCDINSGSQYASFVEKAVADGLVNESVVDEALIHAFKTRIRLGLFDPQQGQPDYSDPSLVGSPKYHALSLDASRQAMTLLSNRNGALPLKPGGKLAVIGANAQTRTLMAGGTGGGLLSAQVVCKTAKNRTDWNCIDSPYDAISKLNDVAGGSTSVSVGASLHGPSAPSDMADAVAAAKAADAVVFVIGGDWWIEHEAMDRSNITLPGDQAALVQKVREVVGASKPIVAVMVHGGSMDISGVLDHADAVVDAFCACT
jgi:beta-D-xylosidase 4